MGSKLSWMQRIGLCWFHFVTSKLENWLTHLLIGSLCSQWIEITVENDPSPDMSGLILKHA